jgi:hypothetical protein
MSQDLLIKLLHESDMSSHGQCRLRCPESCKLIRASPQADLHFIHT